MSWEHAAEARAALNAIVNDPEHGVAALSSAQTMSNLLKDLLPDAPREKSILVAAAEAGLAGTLRDHVNQGMDPATAIRLTASTFSASTPFTPDACNWVTGEIAGALGISQPGSPGGGAFGSTPGAFDPGGQGAATQMAPIPGYTPGQSPTQGPGQGAFGGGQAAGGFGGQGAFDPGATAPGSWQGGQAAGGFGQGTGGAAGGFGAGGTGQPGGGFGQGTGGAAAQPTTAWQPAQQGGGFGAAGTGGAQPGWQPAQQGFGQGGTPGGWQPAGGGGFGPPQRNRRGLFIGGGIAAVVVIIIIVVIAMSGGGNKPTPSPTTPIAGGTTPVTTPATSPVSTPPPTGIEPLATIMNDPGHPVGTNCEDNPPLFGLNSSTVIARRFCAKTTTTDVIVWGYQFSSSATYQAGVTHIKSFTGFDNNTPGKGCPPPSGDSEGTIGWHALHNPRYKQQPGQELDCFMNGKQPRPTLIWTMPSQHVFFIAKDTSAASSLDTIIKWWDDVAYAP